MQRLMNIFPLKISHELDAFAKMIGAKRPGKCASTSHSSIFVMDKNRTSQ